MQRIQRKRGKGWTLPDGYVYVGRPSPWGNPYHIKDLQRLHPNDTPRQLARRACRAFRFYAEERLENDPHWLDPLRKAKGLACWCRLDMPCHADVLIELLKGTQ